MSGNRPCPFCESTRAYLRISPMQKIGARVRCPDCGALGPLPPPNISEKEQAAWALKWWNATNEKERRS